MTSSLPTIPTLAFSFAFSPSCSPPSPLHASAPTSRPFHYAPSRRVAKLPPSAQTSYPTPRPSIPRKRARSSTTTSSTSSTSPFATTSSPPSNNGSPSPTPAPPSSSVEGINAAIAAGSFTILPGLIERDIRTLSYHCILRSSTALVRAADWNAVVRVFNTAAAYPSLRCRFTARLYTDLFFALMKVGSARAAKRAHTEFMTLISNPEDVQLIGPKAYNVVYVALSRAGMIDEAIVVHDKCIENGFYLNRYSYNSFLNACAKTSRLNDAFRTLRSMAESQITPDVVSCNVLIACCVRNGETQVAMELLQRMRDWGISPDIYSYNSVINGLRKSRMLEDAFDLVARMEITAGLPPIEQRNPPGASPVDDGVRPDLVTYNTLMSALATSDPPDLARALEVKDHFERRGLVCNEVSFNALMAAAARGDHIEEAFTMYNEMCAMGLKPNCECFTTLITMCGRAGMLERALQLHQHMIAGGLAPSVVTFNALLTAVRGSEREDCGDVALRVLKVMRETEGCAPDVISYSTVIDALGRDGRLTEMRGVAEDMRGRGIQPNLVTYTSMITALGRHGDLEAALGLVEEMDARGIRPNVYTFSSLINAAGRLGEFGRALEIFARMRKRGIQGSAVTYLMLVQVGVRSGKVEFLKRVMEEVSQDERMNGSSEMESMWKMVDKSEMFAPARQGRVVGEMGRLLRQRLGDGVDVRMSRRDGKLSV